MVWHLNKPTICRVCFYLGMHYLKRFRSYIFVNNSFKTFIHNHGLKTMQAWQIFKYGGVDKLQLKTTSKLPIVRRPIDVLVEVHGASVNPLDVRMLDGYGAATFNFVRQVNSCSLVPQEFPLVLGRDFSGTVIHVGKCVKSIKIGDKVWGATSPWDNGSHANFILTSVCNISKKPSSLNHAEASSVPYAGLTAWAAIKCFGGLSERSCNGKRVLVTGASGGVGTFAVQLLKAWGAEVVATCDTDAVEMLQNLGADIVLDYQDPDFKAHLREMRGFDLILDNVGKDYPALSIDLLKSWKNTKYVTLVSPLLKNTDESGLLLGTVKSATQAALDTVMSVKDGTSFRWAYFIPNGCALKKIAEMVDRKQVIPVIEKTYAFNDIPDAYERVLGGHMRGKVVIDFKSENTTTTEDVKHTM